MVFISLLLGFAVSGCRTARDEWHPPIPDAPPRVVTATRPRAVPSFAADSEAVLKEVEDWRGRKFQGRLEVEFVQDRPAAHADMTCWYDRRTHRLKVLEGKSGSVNRDVLVREFVHALQDQRFDLANLQDRVRDEDAARALSALIEGEALLAVSELLPYELGQQASLPARGPIAPEVFARFFNDSAGQQFVRALRDSGGWEQIDAAFRDPPRRTTEVMNPVLFLEHTRGSDEDALFTAWRLTPYVVTKYERLGAYDVQRLLCQSERLRPRAAELASTVIAGRKISEPDRIWIILLSSIDTAQVMLEAVRDAGATGAECLSPDQRMVSFKPPAGS